MTVARHVDLVNCSVQWATSCASDCTYSRIKFTRDRTSCMV